MAQTSPPVQITSCTIINSPGNYILANNLLGTRASDFACVRIISSNVHLDCNGFSLDGLSAIPTDRSSITGIYLNSVTNVHFENCNIRNYDVGTSTLDSADISINNIDINILRRDVISRPSGMLFVRSNGVYIENIRLTTSSLFSYQDSIENAIDINNGRNIFMDNIDIREYLEGINIAGVNESQIGEVVGITINAPTSTRARATVGINMYSDHNYLSTLNEIGNINIVNMDSGIIMHGQGNFFNNLRYIAVDNLNANLISGLTINGNDNYFEVISIRQHNPNYGGTAITYVDASRSNTLNGAYISGMDLGFLLSGSDNSVNTALVERSVRGMRLRGLDNSVSDLEVKDGTAMRPLSPVSDGPGGVSLTGFLAGYSYRNALQNLRVSNVLGEGVTLYSRSRETVISDLVSLSNQRNGLVFNINDPGDVSAEISGVSSIVANPIDVEVKGNDPLSRAFMFTDKLIFGDVSTGSLVKVSINTAASGIRRSTITYGGVPQTPAPSNYNSFDVKNIKLRNTGPDAIVMDDMVFHWDDSELQGRNENNLRLMKLDLRTNAWTEIPEMPDTAANVIIVSNFNVNDELVGLFFRNN